MTGLGVGFGHCIGMCGPIVLSLTMGVRNRGGTLPHLIYTIGRITTYTGLGAMAGLSGSVVDAVSSMAWLPKTAMVASGLFIVLMGISMAGWIPWAVLRGRSAPIKANPILIGFRALSRSGSILALYGLGMLLGLLPCGPVYTALLVAAGAGMEASGPNQGCLTGLSLMAAFGLGTVPPLFLVSRVAGAGWLQARVRLYRATAILTIGVGFYFTIRGLRW